MQSLMPPIDSPNNEFSDGNPSTGALGTPVPALFLNNVQDAIRGIQRELLSVLSAANINPDGTKNNQVLEAINKLIVSATSSLPVGVPLPYPAEVPPAGFLLCRGGAFDKITYPLLAALYTSGLTPDLRGQTIKGLPASGRALLSLELDILKAHGHDATISNFDYGTKQTSAAGGHTIRAKTGNWNPAIDGGTSNQRNLSTENGYNNNDALFEVVPDHVHPVPIGSHGHTAVISSTGGTENTVKNMAFNYIMRAA